MPCDSGQEETNGRWPACAFLPLLRRANQAKQSARGRGVEGPRVERVDKHVEQGDAAVEPAPATPSWRKVPRTAATWPWAKSVGLQRRRKQIANELLDN